jgi:acyl-[acyl carrier protein]--UDP-N-acetylglucosamine O-acyltransferase
VETRPQEQRKGKKEKKCTRSNKEGTIIEKNVRTDFSATVSEPTIDAGTYVHPPAAVVGNVMLGENIMVSPTACVRGDEGQPLYVGDDSNIQDGFVIHALETAGISCPSGSDPRSGWPSGTTRSSA